MPYIQQVPHTNNLELQIHALLLQVGDNLFSCPKTTGVARADSGVHHLVVTEYERLVLLMLKGN